VKINFFWSGDTFDYLNYLTIKSHVNVGHDVVIHLHGNKPKSIYWDRMLMLGVTIKNADDIINISSFMDKGGNFRTSSSLWRFTFLYQNGGWYSDCDAVAIKPWPDNTEWVLCSAEPDNTILSIGVLKVPKQEKMFLGMIKNIKTKWGNVKVFNDFINNQKRIHKIYNPEQFYPFTWKQWGVLLQDKPIPECVYSVHLYNTMFYRNNKMDRLERWVNENPNTMLGRLDKTINHTLHN